MTAKDRKKPGGLEPAYLRWVKKFTYGFDGSVYECWLAGFRAGLRARDRRKGRKIHA